MTKLLNEMPTGSGAGWYWWCDVYVDMTKVTMWWFTTTSDDANDLSGKGLLTELDKIDKQLKSQQIE